MTKKTNIYPILNLDNRLLLNRGANRKLLVQEWQRLTGKDGAEFNIICGELTRNEYMALFNTDQVTVVPKEARQTEKKLLNEKQTILLAQLEEEQLKEFEKQLGFLTKIFIKKESTNWLISFSEVEVYENE